MLAVPVSVTHVFGLQVGWYALAALVVFIICGAIFAAQSK